jgi:tetratricopeptide (TPR) repeat protein
VRRGVLIAVTGIVLAVGLFVWTVAAREREYRRLVREGEAALASDETFVAIEAFSGAIALRGDSMVAHLRRGEAYRRRNELTAAVRDLRTAADLDASAARAREQLGDVNYALGRYARAAESYLEYVRLDDRSPRVLYKLALAHYRDGRSKAAIAALQQALALPEDLPEVHYLLGLCLRETNPGRARQELERAVRAAPGLVAAREELAALHASQGRSAAELSQLEALSGLEATRPERQIALGLAYARAGRTDQAVATLARAAEQRPDLPEIYVALGRVWLEIAERRSDRVALSKALEALENSVAGGAGTSEAYQLLGRALIRMGSWSAARKALRQAAAILPVEPGTLVDLADVEERLGDLSATRDALVTYLTLEGHDAVRWSDHAIRIASLSSRLQDHQTAVAWYRRLVERYPADTLLAARLVEAEARVGARAIFERQSR